MNKKKLIGYTEINGKLYNTKLMEYKPVDIFISFNNDAEGFHDAKWKNELAEKFTKYMDHMAV